MTAQTCKNRLTSTKRTTEEVGKFGLIPSNFLGDNIWLILKVCVCVHSFFLSPAHSLIHPFIYPFIHLSTHSLINLLVFPFNLLIHSHIHSFISSIHSFIHSLIVLFQPATESTTPKRGRGRPRKVRKLVWTEMLSFC